MDTRQNKQIVNYNSISDWKKHTEALLPSPEQVIERNKAITGQYAKMYEREPEAFKWVGMAAFASYHIGMSLIPFKWINMKLVELPEALEEEGFKNDIQLIRLLNSLIFDDIAWIHLAYLDKNGGIELLRKLFTNEPHYSAVLAAFEKIELGKKLLKTNQEQGEQLIWEANTEILWHEQSAVVQPVFDKLGPAFARAMSLCASFDYKVSHVKTDWRTHSSFILFMLFNGFNKVKNTGFMPIVTNLEHRWHWIENSLLGIWKKTDSTDPELFEKLAQLVQLYPSLGMRD